MNYDTIIKSFEDEKAITDLLITLKEGYFDIIDDYTQQISGEIISTIEELRKAKTTLTGLYASLQPIYSKALTLKKQKEYRFYVLRKEKCEAEGKKFTDSSTTTMAKDAVRVYRDVRDIIFGYLKAAESLIYDCKDRIEQGRKEYSRTKEEN